MANHDLMLKQEAACWAYVETGDKSEAYRRAYNIANMKPATVYRLAKRLFDQAKIGTRVEALQAKHRRAHDVTVASLTAELDEAREVALANKQAGAAVQATATKAQLHSLMVECQEIGKCPT